MTVPAAGLHGIRERSTVGMHEPPARFPRQENQDTLQELLQVVKKHRGIGLLQQTEIVRSLYLRTAPILVFRGKIKISRTAAERKARPRTMPWTILDTLDTCPGGCRCCRATSVASFGRTYPTPSPLQKEGNHGL